MGSDGSLNRDARISWLGHHSVEVSRDWKGTSSTRESIIHCACQPFPRALNRTACAWHRPYMCEHCVIDLHTLSAPVSVGKLESRLQQCIAFATERTVQAKKGLRIYR